jgi:hypothetical protein
MPTFRSSNSSGSGLLPPNAYILQCINCTETVSSKGSQMFKLQLTTIGTVPNDRWVYDFLVFHPNSDWVIQDFCRSAGLEVPIQEADIGLKPDDCILRVCYAKLVHERGRDGKTRLAVERYITRQEAIKLNPDLAGIALPKNAPAAKKLRPVSPTGDTPPSVPAPARKQSLTTAKDGMDIEPDDIPF